MSDEKNEEGLKSPSASHDLNIPVSARRSPKLDDDSYLGVGQAVLRKTSARSEAVDHNSSVQEQVSKVSADLLKTRQEVKDLRKYYAGIDRRLQSKDWNHYAEELSRACQEVETWRNTIELERTNALSFLKEEVHEAFSREEEVLEAQRSHYTCKAVEIWRTAIEQERTQVVSDLTQEVHDALLHKIVGIPLEAAALDMRPMDSTGGALSNKAEVELGSDWALSNVVLARIDSRIDNLAELLDDKAIRIDSRIDKLTDLLDDKAIAIRRMELQCQDISKRFDAEMARQSRLKQASIGVESQQLHKMSLSIIESAATHMEERFQSLTEKLCVENHWARFTYGYDSLQERVEKLVVGLRETEVTLTGVVEQFGDVRERFQIEAENQAGWQKEMSEAVQAQGEEHRSLANLFSLLTQDWSKLSAEMRAEMSAQGKWVETFSAQLNDVSFELTSESDAQRVAVQDLATKIELIMASPRSLVRPSPRFAGFDIPRRAKSPTTSRSDLRSETSASEAGTPPVPKAIFPKQKKRLNLT